MQLLVLPGDGIGAEITAATLMVARGGLAALLARHHDRQHDVGHASLRRTAPPSGPSCWRRRAPPTASCSVPTGYIRFSRTKRKARSTRPILRKTSTLRQSSPGPHLSRHQAPVGDFDLVVVRENTEGFYADRNIEQGGSEMLITPDVVISLRRITRPSARGSRMRLRPAAGRASISPSCTRRTCSRSPTRCSSTSAGTSARHYPGLEWTRSSSTR